MCGWKCRRTEWQMENMSSAFTLRTRLLNFLTERKIVFDFELISVQMRLRLVIWSKAGVTARSSFRLQWLCHPRRASEPCPRSRMLKSRLHDHRATGMAQMYTTSSCESTCSQAAEWTRYQHKR